MPSVYRPPRTAEGRVGKAQLRGIGFQAVRCAGSLSHDGEGLVIMPHARPKRVLLALAWQNETLALSMAGYARRAG